MSLPIAILEFDATAETAIDSARLFAVGGVDNGPSYLTTNVTEIVDSVSEPAIDSISVFWSPYNWYRTSTYAVSNTPGAYFKTRFRSTAFSITVDVADLIAASTIASRYPVIEWSVDGGAFSRFQLLNSSSVISLASGLSDAWHTVELYFDGVTWNSGDRWNTPANALKITGISTASGGVLQGPAKRPNRVMFYGDSHAEGYETRAAGTTVANQSARLAWPKLLADKLDAEYGIAGFAGQGYITPESSVNLPSMQDSWDFLFSGRARDLTGVDYIVSGHGTNDTSGDAMQTGITTTCQAILDDAPSDAKLLLIMPPNNGKRALILDAVDDVHDDRCIAVPTNFSYMSVPANVNGGHLSEAGQVEYTEGVWDLLEPLLETPPPEKIQFVAGTANGGAEDACVSGEINTTGADLLVIVVGWVNGAGTSPIVADSKGNTWTLARKQLSAAGNQNVGVFYSKPTSVGTNHTVSITLNNSYPTVWFSAFSGSGSSQPDQVNSATAASGTALAAGSITPTVQNSLVISGVIFGTTAGTTAASSGFTGGAIAFSSGNHVSLGYGHKTKSVAEAINPSWTWTPSQSNVCAVVVNFNPATAPPADEPDNSDNESAGDATGRYRAQFSDVPFGDYHMIPFVAGVGLKSERYSVVDNGDTVFQPWSEQKPLSLSLPVNANVVQVLGVAVSPTALPVDANVVDIDSDVLDEIAAAGGGGGGGGDSAEDIWDYFEDATGDDAVAKIAGAVVLAIAYDSELADALVQAMKLSVGSPVVNVSQTLSVRRNVGHTSALNFSWTPANGSWTGTEFTVSKSINGAAPQPAAGAVVSAGVDTAGRRRFTLQYVGADYPVGEGTVDFGISAGGSTVVVRVFVSIPVTDGVLSANPDGYAQGSVAGHIRDIIRKGITYQHRQLSRSADNKSANTIVTEVS